MGRVRSNVVPIGLTVAEAIVLFEFLSRFHDAGSLSVEDASEEWVLDKVFGALQRKLADPSEPNYRDVLERARALVRDHIE